MAADSNPMQSRVKLSKKVARNVENLIIRGDFKPGSLLPTEAELGQQFGVSRTVIREAVRTLEARGLVHIRHGIGTQVTAGGKSAFTAALLLMLRRSGCTMQDVFDFRKLVEPEFAAVAALRANGRDLAEMEEALASYVATEADAPALAEEHHRRFHQAILRGTHNPVVEAMIDPLTEMIVLTVVPRASGILPRLPSKELKDIEAHRSIFECIKAGNSLGARRAMLTDFDNARTDIDTTVTIGSREDDWKTEEESGE